MTAQLLFNTGSTEKWPFIRHTHIYLKGTRTIHSSRQMDRIQIQLLECGPMPNVMVALPNIGGALCSTPQSLADAQYWNVMQ